MSTILTREKKLDAFGIISKFFTSYTRRSWQIPKKVLPNYLVFNFTTFLVEINSNKQMAAEFFQNSSWKLKALSNGSRIQLILVLNSHKSYQFFQNQRNMTIKISIYKAYGSIYYALSADDQAQSLKGVIIATMCFLCYWR